MKRLSLAIKRWQLGGHTHGSCQGLTGLRTLTSRRTKVVPNKENVGTLPDPHSYLLICLFKCWISFSFGLGEPNNVPSTCLCLLQASRTLLARGTPVRSAAGCTHARNCDPSSLKRSIPQGFTRFWPDPGPPRFFKDPMVPWYAPLIQNPLQPVITPFHTTFKMGGPQFRAL